MLKAVLLDRATLGDDADLTEIESLVNLTVYENTNSSETIERIREADIIITNKVWIGAEEMDSAKNLKLICISATGMNNVDLEAAAARKINVKNVVGYSTDSVAQLTIAMYFHLTSQMSRYDSFVKSGSWCDSPNFTTHLAPFYELKGQRWGIIGLGNIGRRVAEVAATFGAEVVYYSTSGKNRNPDYEQVSLAELLETCDVISIHAPLNENTLGLLGEKELNLTKEKSVILNLGRGGIIDEAAMASALNSREIYHGTDVLAKEPMEKGHPYLSLKHPERLVITPHIGWASVEARQTLLAAIAENIRNF